MPTVAHLPEICSYGNSCGWNALLGKRCFALRLGSILGHREGRLSEHRSHADPGRREPQDGREVLPGGGCVPQCLQQDQHGHDEIYPAPHHGIAWLSNNKQGPPGPPAQRTESSAWSQVSSLVAQSCRQAGCSMTTDGFYSTNGSDQFHPATST
ncbi:uncharacterized protein LOC143299872 [Babylonia areolata]|uniref:uncharacterized protein LOC143299872 n=1 Tax=Babylonia areolata TaxID=304850 RepID=UPI003FCF9D8A